jgi:hypothetical protein
MRREWIGLLHDWAFGEEGVCVYSWVWSPGVELMVDILYTALLEAYCDILLSRLNQHRNC